MFLRGNTSEVFLRAVGVCPFKVMTEMVMEYELEGLCIKCCYQCLPSPQMKACLDSNCENPPSTSVGAGSTPCFTSEDLETNYY